nr:MAG TPA: repressor protein [Caudoviricetes sp.]
MVFSERLGELIKEKGVAWKVVSKELEIGINQKRYWETHGNLPDGETLKKLSDYFGVSVPYLMGETDERGQKKSPAQMDGAGVDDELRRIWDAASDDERGLILDMARMVRDRSRKGE